MSKVKVKVIEIDGWSDWNPIKVKDVTLKEFTPQACASYLSDGETNDPNDFCHNGQPVVLKGTITLMGEENGHIFVLMS